MGENLFALMIDEFMFLKAATYPTTLPLLKNGAAFIIVSSEASAPADEIKQMMYAKLGDGRDVMRRLNWIRACLRCTAQGNATRCSHFKPQPEHFQSHGAQERLEALMRPFGEAAVARELYNQAARPTIEPVFPNLWLQPLRDRTADYAPGATPTHHRAFFVGYDPAGDGFSQNVLVSVLFDAAAAPSPYIPYLCVVRAHYDPYF
jgi:hypothetical protein